MDTKVQPPEVDPPHPEEEHDPDEAMPRVEVTRRSLVVGGFFIVSALAFLYFVLPQLADLKDSGRRVGEGNRWWLAAAFLFTLASFGGYVMMFQGIFVRAGSRVDWRASYQITMAGLAATRLFAAGGAGGIALTAWALRRSGMPRRTVADKTLAFLILTYAVYMAALVVCGFGLYYGLLPGPGPFAITVVPAIFALIVIALALGLSRVPPDLQGRLEGFARRGGRLARFAQALSNAPAAFSAGMRESLWHVRERDPALLGAIAYWGFNVAVLWACFHAFGEPPPLAVIIMGYFVGFLGNLLPLPGGIGGVDGGMIGAFAAFGVDFSLIVPAVLAYRIFTFWLPTIPGAIAYFQLRRTVARWREERRARELPAAASA
ncbi:MAG: lysylphosphatidylglycerol synthase transmembrane domain-containing protein [Solirubrobacteraceae bacterium]|nr:lysylphosphatidylglycerol synthase transmembrane domain-containing protein [Solirubrobacteraceae bacterium]